MKNGFTLVELLAILVLLSIIILVSVPLVIDSNKTALENRVKAYNDAVKMACDSYKAASGTNSTGITVEFLKREGYLKENLTKPDDQKTVEKAITSCP